jgi:hypothetical protein
MDLEDRLISAMIGLGVLLVAAALIAFGVWAWRDAADRRDCRRAGGVVTDTQHDWHCVGATPEAK